MRMSLAMAAGAALVLSAVVPADIASAGSRRFEPGSPGIGDPHYPLAGNGGYDARHYDLEVSYDPATDVLRGTGTIVADATQDLSSFNLDLDGLTVRRVRVDGRAASFQRDGGELTVEPQRGIRKRSTFIVAISYDGVPETIDDALGISGFIHTDDGALVAGQPRVASTWYPVNDHPSDTASNEIAITVPAGLTAMSNGLLQSERTRHGWTTWTWVAREPMASYLTTMTVGEFDVRSYRAGGIRYWDATSSAIRSGPTRWWCTNSRTSGSVTTCRSPAGRTSG